MPMPANFLSRPILNDDEPERRDPPGRDNDPRRDNDGQDGNNMPGSGTMLKTRPKAKQPSLYKVLLLNDDYTPMDFVIHILEKFFSKTAAEATEVMLHVHRRGVGICGIYTFEVAETKVAQVMDYARAHEQPLQCTMEKE